eukprot:TRINITY_DN10395_c0_g2_i5.p1 TRINITY_DN10395_c0_g2~~TRINITY_DN10395_c0_g2_i5.p1  ORF type:complete len:116 (-),score=16.95 TRINITY_DN10395_c0_g2_i5:135-434(-)
MCIRDRYQRRVHGRYKMQRAQRSTTAREAARQGQMKSNEKSAPSGRPTRTFKKKSNEGFTFYAEESEGLMLGPKTVVALGLIYMGVVVLLHIISKVRGQ